jgi:hypothetical protein
MPTPLVAVASAAVVALGGFGVGSMMVNSGGASHAAPSRVPPLAADSTGRPAHSRYVYAPPRAQQTLPGLGSIPGQAPSGGAPPGGGPAYVPKGAPKAPLGPVPAARNGPQATTWTLYLSGGDLLQPDPGVAVQTHQSVGPALGGPCSPGLAGRWESPAPGRLPLHGPIPGLLHIEAPGTVSLQLSFISSTLGGSCTVLGTTSVVAMGTQAVSFTLPRVDVDLPAGVNVGLVISAAGSATVTSTAAAPSYVVAPTPPQ